MQVHGPGAFRGVLVAVVVFAMLSMSAAAETVTVSSEQHSEQSTSVSTESHSSSTSESSTTSESHTSIQTSESVTENGETTTDFSITESSEDNAEGDAGLRTSQVHAESETLSSDEVMALIALILEAILEDIEL